MNTKAKSNSVITHEVDNDEGNIGAGSSKVRFNVLGVGALTLDMTKLNQCVLDRASIHGMIQRISDAAAISRNPETGKPATAQEKYDAMARLVNHYESGSAEWRIAGGGGIARSSVLLDAMVQLFPNRTRDDLKVWLAGKSKAERAKLAQSSRVRPIIAAMTPVSGDADAMLDELDQAE